MARNNYNDLMEAYTMYSAKKDPVPKGNNKSSKGTGYSELLKNYGGFLVNPFVGLAGMAINKIPDVTNSIKNRLYNNISPYGYNTNLVDENGNLDNVNALQRVLNAVVLNKPEAERTQMMNNPSGYDKEKDDLWGMYLGKGQKYNTIQPSQYRPTKGDTPSDTYYQIPKVEQELINEIQAKDFADFRNQFFSLVRSGQLGGTSTGIEEDKGFAISNMQPLGDAKLSPGEDDKGYYVSYYDKWDLNPFSGNSADNKSWYSGLAKTLGLDKANDLLGNKGINVYGRVYYDKKTGKRIQK